ncbi:hypothetical protein HK096_007959, partial [Nowakowskiella sp. JEL0078]
MALDRPLRSNWLNETIASRRSDWQTWLQNTYPKRATFDAAVSIIRKGGVNVAPRGVVVVFTPELMAWLVAGIKMLRKYGCKLPIEVWCFRDELSDVNMRTVEALGEEEMLVSVRFADETWYPMSVGRGVEEKGYHIKIVALANSGFENVLMMDCDAFAMSNPEYLFDSVEYIQFGALFWPDYWRTTDNSPVWEWMDQPCVDEREQESGIMFVNRRRTWKALNLLWYLNRNQEIRNWHNFLNGDKDMFRFAFRAAGTPGYFIPHLVAPGGFRSSRIFCGISMMQHDIEGKLLFAHINLLKGHHKLKFTKENNALSLVKRYKPMPPSTIKHYWDHAIGTGAILFSHEGFYCIDLLEQNIDGLIRFIEEYNLADDFKEFQNDIYDNLI